jgi:hypothetical protein
MTFQLNQYVTITNKLARPRGQIIRRCRHDSRYWVVRVEYDDVPIRIRERDLEAWVGEEGGAGMSSPS